MNDYDVFLTLAEVSVAFAGFASLVGILGHSDSVDDPRVLGVRMRVMLTSSLMVVAFSLLPIIIERLGGSPQLALTLSTWLLLAAVAILLVWIQKTFARLVRAVRSVSTVQRRIVLPVLYLDFFALAVLLIANVVFRSPGIYLGVLALLLFLAGFAFALIVYSFLPRLEQTPPD